ncbi:MAG TPA: hypothetical protein DDW27_03810 [Bacteroidales bacterium]|nr:hypothetical protein [Bacteroidales bacterium]
MKRKIYQIIFFTVTSLTLCGQLPDNGFNNNETKDYYADKLLNDSFKIIFRYDVLKPSDVPVILPLSRNKPYFDGGMVGRAAGPNDYQPYNEGSFMKTNGRSEQTYVITTGVWRLLVGDRPVIGLDQRNTRGAYARPGILPHLAVKGKIRLQVSNKRSTKYLEDFSKITTILSAGEPKWICEDNDLQVKVNLTAHAFLEDFGCAVIAQIESGNKENRIELNWHYENADHIRDASSFMEFSYDKYTRIFVGNTRKETNYHNGVAKTVIDGNTAKPAADTLVCVWGYTDYDRDEVANAYKRLWFRPFPSKEWSEQMQNNWFHHWIGRGLEPDKKFIKVLENPAVPVKESKEFWKSMRNRIRVKTGDERFDNAVQSLGSRLISNYEYPGYPHGSNYMKYGKINCGLYAHEAAGFHGEVATTLKFIAGTQCVKGRQRYMMPDFLISQWAEEMNPYFIDQIWYHYRWTGDREFLFEMWPSARRALEHLISTSDPDHDGFFTGIYENWNGDAKDRGGRGALWTGLCANALRIGFNIASLFEDVDWTLESQAPKPADNDFRLRYKRLLQRAEAAYEELYNKKIGAYSSGDWDSELRNMPGNEESNYNIWRGMGDPLRNYTSMRFIRDTYHEKSDNGIFEFSNKDWPVCWSNHYDSFSDAMSSVASAAMANDINNFWPLLKTAAEGIYTRPECTVLAGGASQLSLESDQMFMMAVLDNIFGIKPYFGENLLVIRPSFPDAWKNPEIELPDVSYKYIEEENGINLVVNTPVERILKAEIPLKQQVKEVTVNGRQVEYETRKEVNCCRLIIKSDASTRHEIKVSFVPNNFYPEGNVNCIVKEMTSFRFDNVELVKVENPQIYFGTVTIKGNLIEVRPEKTGNFTLFAELKNGNVSWYQPIELIVKEPWSIIEEYKAWDGEPGTSAKLLSPSINKQKKVLQFKLENNTSERQTGEMIVEITGQQVSKTVALPPYRSVRFEIPVKNLLKQMSPGTVLFKVMFKDDVKISHATDWELPVTDLPGKRVIPLDIRNYYNISLSQLYGTGYFKWRTDYTGAAVGVDWRDTLYVDRLGYKLFVPPTSVISYGILPEQHSPAWWSVPDIPDTLEYPVPFPFTEHRRNKNNVIALVNAENNRNLPGEAILELKRPLRAEKIYLMTANLTKTCKSYYPAAEVEVEYETGKNQIVQLTPPYNMPSMIQAFCPDALQIPLGKIENNQVFLSGVIPGISVTDIVTDPARKITKMTFKCVTSETVLGIIGINLLQAE